MKWVLCWLCNLFEIFRVTFSLFVRRNWAYYPGSNLELVFSRKLRIEWKCWWSVPLEKIPQNKLKIYDRYSQDFVMRCRKAFNFIQTVMAVTLTTPWDRNGFEINSEAGVKIYYHCEFEDRIQRAAKIGTLARAIWDSG